MVNVIIMFFWEMTKHEYKTMPIDVNADVSQKLFGMENAYTQYIFK